MVYNMWCLTFAPPVARAKEGGMGDITLQTWHLPIGGNINQSHHTDAHNDDNPDLHKEIHKQITLNRI